MQGCCKDQDPDKDGCQKDKPLKYLGDYPLGEIKDYLYYQPGSWWVYECDSTLELDSQVMKSIDTPWYNKSYITYQLMDYDRYSESQKVHYRTTYGSTDVPYNEGFGPDQYTFSNAITSSNGGTDCIFFYPFRLNGTGGGGSSSTYYRGYLDSMQVLGKWYKDIRIFETRGAAWPRCNIETWEGARYTIFWSKHIGLIKLFNEAQKRGFNTSFHFNWNLKNYQVQQ